MAHMRFSTLARGDYVLRSAREVIGQFDQLLRKLKKEEFVAVSPVVGASIGQHLRHTLDHFEKLLKEKEVDYDSRERGSITERDIGAARVRVEKIQNLLCELENENVDLSVPVHINVMTHGCGRRSTILTNFKRELWFVTHHAIHHAALIKIIASQFNYDLPTSFGMAPSTILYNDEKE